LRNSESSEPPVRGIALTRVGWDSAPRRIRLASGRKVAVDWSQIRHMIRIIDTNYQRIDLLIISVETTSASAELALAMATDGQDAGRAVDRHRIPRPSRREMALG
jgi:Family of unknown function (DUF5994)